MASRCTTSTASDNSAQPDSRRPLDQVLHSAIVAAAEEHDGFVFSAARSAHDQPVQIEIKPTLPVHDEWEPPAGYRAHTLVDADSLITYAKKYGTPEKSLVLYNDDGAVLVIDDQVERGLRERISLKWEFHDDWKAWGKIINGEPLQHRDLLKHLIRRAYTLGDPSLLAAMRSVKATMSVKFDSDIRDDKESVTLAFVSEKAEGLITFPKSFQIQLPVLAGDDPSDSYSIDIAVEVMMPESQGKPVMFLLTSPEWVQTLRARLSNEMDRVANDLNGWTIVRGTHNTVDRNLPRG